MSMTDKSLAVGFRKMEEISALLSQVLNEAGTDASFAYGDELASVVGALSKEVVPLVYSQVLERIDVHFAEEEIHIELDYYPELDQEDDLDTSFLKLVSTKADKLAFNIVVNQEECATYLGADKIPSLSTEHVEVSLVCLEKQTAEEGGKSSSEGSPDNGNES